MSDELRRTTDTAEERLARLIDRMMIAAEAAASSGAWERVQDIATDILAAAPDHQRAASMLERARVEQSLPEGHRAFVSLIFSDIVRSTDLAARIEPEIVRDLLRLYRNVATETIEGLGGQILQYLGDGIFACFGFPNVHEDDATRAVLAGLGLVDRMAAAAPDLRRRYGIDAPIRVGVHTGTVVVAGLTHGADAINIVGVAAHVAARLQSEAEPGTVVISEATRQLVDTHFEVATMGPRTLKGISEPVEVFRALRPSQGARLQVRGRLQSVALVGREVPRRSLHETWANVLQSSGRGETTGKSMVVLRGPAGIGKSRLAADVCERVQADGGVILQAACSPYHTNVALWPIGQMLEHRMGLYPQQPPESRLAEVARRVAARGFDSAKVLPLLAPLLGLELDRSWARPEVDPVALRTETLRVLAEWLARVAQATPGVLVVEDLHWADPTTVDLLGLLAASDAPGVMVLVTSREPLATPWAHQTLDLELGPLADDDAAMLVGATAPDGNLTAEHCRLIVQRGGGVPLYIQELARSALTSATGEGLPHRLQEVLAARVRAPGIDLRVTQLAAAIGSVFDEELLRDLAGGPVIEALAQLQTAGIIEPLGDARRVGYRFRHVLFRDAAYETQVLDARRATHARIAQLLALTAAAPGELTIVAQHLDLAGNVEQAIPAYIEAAKASQSEASHTEARRLLDRALELLGGLPQGDERDLTELAARMLRTMSVSSLFGYGYHDVFEDLQLSERICRRYRERPETMPAQVGIWSCLIVRGELESARIVLEPLATSIGAPETEWFAPEIKSCLGYNALYAGDLEGARRCLEEAWEGYLARTAEQSVSPYWPLPNDPVPVTAVAMACIAGLEGKTAESATWERRALSTAEQIGFPRGPFSAAFVTTYLAWLRMITGDEAGARAFGQRTLEVADQYRFDYFGAVGRPYLLMPDADNRADVDELEACEAAMDLVGHGAFRPVFLGIVARNHALHGDHTRALERVEDALERAQKSGELVHQPDLLRVRAEITAAAHPHRSEDVLSDLLTAVEIGLSQGSLVLALRAANGLAWVPPGSRPPHWRDIIQNALNRFPRDSTSPEIAEALAVLGA